VIWEVWEFVGQFCMHDFMASSTLYGSLLINVVHPTRNILEEILCLAECQMAVKSSKIQGH
jgi:hypothetical protein